MQLNDRKDSQYLKPSDTRSTLPKRLPVHKKTSFKFPPKIPLEKRIQPVERKVSLISNKNFRNLQKGFRKEDLFLGSLKIF